MFGAQPWANTVALLGRHLLFRIFLSEIVSNSVCRDTRPAIMYRTHCFTRIALG